jgi:hypothetical protein
MNSVLKSQTNLFNDPSKNYNESEKPLNLSSVQNQSVLLDFDGGHLSSDAGLLLLREVEQQIGVIKALADTIHDPRDSRYVKHQLEEMLTQRIFQIAAGYEDADDCDSLKNDPILKMCADRLPESDEALASQPTMSRFENSISRTYLYRLAKVLIDHFIQSYEKEPKLIVLDFDDTEDKTHGNQQLTLFNKFYHSYCFQPLHVYEGISGKLVTTILKPGKRSNGKQALAIVKRLIRYVRAHWPNTIIVFRGDSHFAYPEVMEWIETQKNVHHLTGLTGYPVLKEQVKAHVKRAKQLYEKLKRPVRLFHSFYYQADSWNKPRRVVAKIEKTEHDLNLRFVVTDMEQAKANVLYNDLYCHRGNAELYIKDHKLYLKSDRTSCHRFVANQFRLFLSSAAYVLIHALKTNILKTSRWSNATIATIRLRLFKIGARVRQLKTRVKVELPSSCPVKTTLTKSFQIFEVLQYSG